MPSIITNASIAALGRTGNSVIGVGITALLARFLGVENYGLYSVIISFGAMCQIAADFGLYLFLTQRLGQDQEQYNKYIPPVLSLRLALLVVWFSIGAAVATFIPALRESVGALGIISVGLLFQSISQLCMGIYQAHQSVVWATVGDTIGRVVQLLGLLLLFYNLELHLNSVSSITLATLLFSLSTGVTLWWHLWRLPTRQFMKVAFTWPDIKYITIHSWPLGLLLLLNTIYFRIDMIMLPFWRSANEIGLYALAYRLIENILFFPAMLGGLLLPIMSRSLHNPTSKESEELVHEGMKALLVGATIVGVVCLTIPATILTLVAGPAFMAAAPLLRVLTVALIIMFFGNLFGFFLVAQEKGKFLLRLYAVLVVVNILGNFIAIPRFGAMAAAWTTVGTEAIACLAAAYMVTRKIHLSLSLDFSLRVLVLGVGTVLSALLIPPLYKGIPQLIGTLFVALVLAVFLRLITRQELPHLWAPGEPHKKHTS